MTPDGTHAIVSLRESFSSFLAQGIDDLPFDPAQLEDPSSSYFKRFKKKSHVVWTNLLQVWPLVREFLPEVSGCIRHLMLFPVSVSGLMI